jgi:hypothetical protein
VRLTLDIHDMLVASWRVGADAVARVLPPGLEPAETNGRHVVSAVFLRYSRARLGRLPAPSFAGLNIRVYTFWEGERAAYFLDARVTSPGKPAALFLPVRTAHLRVRRGRAQGLGLDLRYDVDGPVDPGDLGRLELGLFPAAGLKALRVRRGPAEWRRAELLEPARVDPILALGFDVREPAELLYVGEASLEAELPTRRVA